MTVWRVITTAGLCLAKASNGDDPVGSFSYATTNLGVLNKPVAWSPLHATPLAHATNKPVVIHELQVRLCLQWVLAMHRLT